MTRREDQERSGSLPTREDPIKGNFGQRCRVLGQGGALTSGRKTEWNLNLFTQKNSETTQYVPKSTVLRIVTKIAILRVILISAGLLM